MADYHFYRDHQDILNYCAKYLARFNADMRHSYGAPGTAAPRDRIAEAWRFPLIDPGTFGDYNEVTFIYAGADSKTPASVSVVGTFAALWNAIPMRRVMFEGEPSRY